MCHLPRGTGPVAQAMSQTGLGHQLGGYELAGSKTGIGTAPDRERIQSLSSGAGDAPYFMQYGHSQRP